MSNRKKEGRSDHKGDYERLVFERERRNIQLERRINEMEEQIERLKVENKRLAAELEAARERASTKPRTPPTKSKVW